jgi:hypothetical protein
MSNDMATTHKCNKEREIGMMVIEIRNLKEGQDRIEKKLDVFIDTADHKYATKDELAALKAREDKQDNEITWTKEKIIDLLMKVASVTAIIVFGAKSAGVI